MRVSAGGPAALLLDAVLAVAPIVTSRQTETYSASAPVQAGPTWVYTLTYSGSVAPGGSTGDLKFRVSLNNSASGSFAIAATASAEAVTGASTTATVHF